MTHTPKIEQAIRKVALLHHGQTRKGEIDYPYVTHLFSVAAIISKHVDDEGVIVAGLLHDTLEDTEYTREELRQDFGDRIASIVEGVTIPETPPGETPNWSNSREAYIENLRKAPTESAIVSAADKIHNFTSILSDYADDSKRFWNDFGGTYEKRVAAYAKIVETIEEKLGSDHPIARELKSVYEKYAAFLKTTL